MSGETAPKKGILAPEPLVSGNLMTLAGLSPEFCQPVRGGYSSSSKELVKAVFTARKRRGDPLSLGQRN